MSLLSFIIASASATETPVKDSTAIHHIGTRLQELSNMSIQELITTITKDLINIGLKMLAAIVIYYVGRWLIKRIIKILMRIMEKRDVDISLRSFLKSMVSISLTIFLIVIIVGTIGVDLTSLIAIFASAGLAVGMALSGTLQNFAGGVIILLFKPFRVGDFIEAQGQTGTVKEIQLVNTVINTTDNKTILLPNGNLSTGIINNYSREENRRVEWVFGIAYGDDYDVAKKQILELIAADDRILTDPAPFVALKELADSSVNIVVRVWVDNVNYWAVYFDLNEKVYKTFGEKGLNFPFPQMDVHVIKPEA